MSIFNFQNNVPSETFPTGSVTILPDYSNVNNALTNADFDPPEQKTTNLQGLSYTQLKVEFTNGWNMFAYPGYEPMDAVHFFNLISDNHVEDFSIVKDANAKTYWPEYGYNSIGDLIPGQGYQIKWKRPSTSEFTPDTVGFLDPTSPPEDLTSYLDLIHNNTIDLTFSWNLIGYNRQGTAYDPLETFYKAFYPNDLSNRSKSYMFDKLVDIGVDIIKDNEGRLIYPTKQFLHSNFELIEGQGYQIRMNKTFSNFKFPPTIDVNVKPLIDGGPR